MRIARVFSVLLAIVTIGLLSAAGAGAEPPFRVQNQVTDNAGVLSSSQRADVQAAVDRLFNDRRIKLWVVYVKTFDGLGWLSWSQRTEQLSDFGTDDALLAIATEDRSFAFNVDPGTAGGSSTLTDSVRREHIEPALRVNNWAGAAIGAADGLNVTPSQPTQISGRAMLIALAVVVVLVLLLWWWLRSRRRRRHRDELAAAKRMDATDPQALATVSLEVLDELSRQIVVDVDNAVRTSDNELTLAVEEFGANRTEPFSKAVENAKTTLAQAFNVRQMLDDRSP